MVYQASEGHRQDFHPGPTQGRILGAVCAQRHLDATVFQAATRSRQVAETRTFVAYLAVETGAATLTTIGTLVHRDVATLSHAMHRVRQKLADDVGSRQVGSLEKQLQGEGEH